MKNEFLNAFIDGLVWAAEIAARVTGAGIVLIAWLFVTALLIGHFMNWLILVTGSKK